MTWACAMNVNKKNEIPPPRRGASSLRRQALDPDLILSEPPDIPVIRAASASGGMRLR